MREGRLRKRWGRAAIGQAAQCSVVGGGTMWHATPRCDEHAMQRCDDMHARGRATPVARVELRRDGGGGAVRVMHGGGPFYPALFLGDPFLPRLDPGRPS